MSWWKDTFAGTVGTLLSAHNDDNGHGYTLEFGVDNIELDGTGGLIDGPTQPIYTMNQTPAGADVTITFDENYLTASFDAGNAIGARIANVVSGVTTGDGLYVNVNPGGPNFRLIQHSAGVISNIDVLSFAFAPPQVISCKLELVGNQARMTAGGNTNGFVTTAITAAGKGGYRGFSSGAGSTTGVHVQNVLGIDAVTFTYPQLERFNSRGVLRGVVGVR